MIKRFLVDEERSILLFAYLLKDIMVHFTSIDLKQSINKDHASVLEYNTRPV